MQKNTLPIRRGLYFQAAEMSNIANLIQKARNACTNGDTLNAKRFVLLAITKANTANQRPLTAVQPSRTDHWPNDWHWGYSFVMNQVNS